MRLRAPLLALLLVACTSVPPATPSPHPTRVPTQSQSVSPVASARRTPEATAPPSFSEPALSNRFDPLALFSHIEALQRIADEAGGTRSTGTPGFDASARYVTDVLTDTGYLVEEHRFDVGGVAGVNLLADVAGSGEGVLIVGAHLDSVPAGPGINDNASGVAALLELARAFQGLPPPPLRIRFAFWGAEEGGPFGSAAYVADLTRAERDEIVAYLNVDMIGSPNAFVFVYQEADAAPGSERITAAFAGFLEFAGHAWDPIDLDGDSDHGPFVDAGVPTGGLFSGGIEPVSDDQARRSGTAIAGQPADPCSHRACDTIANVDRLTLSRLAQVLARVVGRLAIDGVER